MFPTQAVSSATQRKILRVLAEKNRSYTISDLAEMCHRSEASISRALRHADRYPFIEKSHVSGSKQLTFRLNPDNPYTAAIRRFYSVEHDRERQNGTIPVEVWNLLEDVATTLEDRVDGFIDVVLFGSYATGEYYTGSDIDLLLIHTQDTDVETAVEETRQKIGDDRLQILQLQIEEAEADDITAVLRERSPVKDTDTIIPLLGEVKP